MGGHGEPGVEGPVIMDGATDITAEGGIGAALRSTLGLIGSSVMTMQRLVSAQRWNTSFVLLAHYVSDWKNASLLNIYLYHLYIKDNFINYNHLWDLGKIKNSLPVTHMADMPHHSWDP